MRWIALILGMAFVVTGCEDEPVPEPNLPMLGAAKAQCRKVEGVYKLNLIEITVSDLDGVEDLEKPTVFVESEELTMVATPQGGASEECKTDNCEMLYTWEYDQDGEQIFCGEDGKLLIIDFEVKDLEGFPTGDAIKTVPL